MADKENRSADVADHTRTHNALRELCRQRGTSLEEQSECGEDIVLWADALMRELETDLDQAIAWLLDGDDEWSDAQDVLLSAMMARHRQDRKAAAPAQSATLDEIAAEHGREVKKLLYSHYTTTKSPLDSIAALTVDALAKAGAIWEKQLAELSELRDNHLPKVEAALQRANKIGAECDRQIKALEANLIMAHNYLRRMTPSEATLTTGGAAGYKQFLASIKAVLASTAEMMKGVEVTEPQNLRAIHYREAFDLAIQCIEFGASNHNGGEEFLDALRKYADLTIKELDAAADTEIKDPTT